MTKQEFLNLPNGQVFVYKEKEYKFNVYERGLMSINSNRVFGDSMNVGKVTDQYVSLFTYDMMGQLSKYKISLSEITLKK
jgi:hypothetical protein